MYVVCYELRGTVVVLSACTVYEERVSAATYANFLHDAPNHLPTGGGSVEVLNAWKLDIGVIANKGCAPALT